MELKSELSGKFTFYLKILGPLYFHLEKHRVQFSLAHVIVTQTLWSFYFILVMGITVANNSKIAFEAYWFFDQFSCSWQILCYSPSIL